MKLKDQGLYLSEFEHDNCGAGFICSLNGERTNTIISKALNILTCLEHRGAVSSDGRTGDGQTQWRKPTIRRHLLMGRLVEQACCTTEQVRMTLLLSVVR